MTLEPSPVGRSWHNTPMGCSIDPPLPLPLPLPLPVAVAVAVAVAAAVRTGCLRLHPRLLAAYHAGGPWGVRAAGQ